MAGNTSSSASSRSVGYPAQSTNVTVWTDGLKGGTTNISSLSPNAINIEALPGVIDALRKNKNNYAAVLINTPFGSQVQLIDASVADVASSGLQRIGTPVFLSDRSGENLKINYYYKPSDTKNTVAFADAYTPTPAPAPAQNPLEYQWNLPPHKWSMPFTPGTDLENMPDGYRKGQSSDRYRRGRIWWKFNSNDLSVQGGDGKSQKLDSADRKYGFQFLWNPESFGTAVSVQMDATPNAGDRFLSGAGYFPATEVISFTLRVDRTNDFAAANSYFKRPSNIYTDIANSGTNNFISTKDVAEFVKYYQNVGSFSSPNITNGKKENVEKKLIDLFQRGTLADIEYLYKSINGPGPGNTASGADYWKNARGITTADIGFLMPTLLNIDIGPLSYIGYATSLSVTHIGFTPDMIPIRSDVQISFNLLATAGLTAGGIA
jgi:hypothetical protein